MSDRRRAARLPLEVPAGLASRGGLVLGEVQDVSVLGARLFVLTSSFGLASQPTLLGTALAVRDALGPRFDVHLDHERVGEIRRVAGIARLALPSHARGCVELGCEFEMPLAQEEIIRLAGGVFDAASLETFGGRRREDRAQRIPATGDATPSFRAEVRSTARETPSLLVCRTEALSRDGFRLRVDGGSMQAADAAEASVAFMRRYGNRVHVDICDGPRSLWTGRAEVFGLEVKLSQPDELMISLGYERPLEPIDLDQLGIAASPA